MASEIARALDPSSWKRLSAGEGTKGARLHDWAYCELADLDAAEYDDERIGLWTRGLLIRRNIVDGDMAFFYLVSGPERASKLWSRSRDIAGRSRTALRPPRTNSGSTIMKRAHGTAGIVIISLVMLRLRHRWPPSGIHANATPPPKNKTPKDDFKDDKTAPPLIGWSRKSAASPSALPKDGSTPLTSLHGPFGDAHIKPLLEKLTSNGICNCNARQRAKVPEADNAQLVLEREATAELERERVAEFERELAFEMNGDRRPGQEAEETQADIEPTRALRAGSLSLDGCDADPVGEALVIAYEAPSPESAPQPGLPVWLGSYPAPPLVAHLYVPWTPPKVVPQLQPQLQPQPQPQRERGQEPRRRLRLSRGGWR